MQNPTISAHSESVILNVSGMQFASEQTKVAAYLERQIGVVSIEVNPVSETATMMYDNQQIGVEQLQEPVAECGYHCSGQALPRHHYAPATQHDDHHSPISLNLPWRQRPIARTRE